MTAQDLARSPRETGRQWVLAIILFFVFVAVLQGFLVYVAVTNPDPVVESYDDAPRR